MRAYCDIFERTEQKYQMTASACQFLLDAAGNRIVPDEYPTAQVRSLYYDTPQFDLIEKSLTRSFRSLSS